MSSNGPDRKPGLAEEAANSVGDAPAVVRIAASTWVRAAGWGIGEAFRAYTRAVEATAGEQAADVVRDLGIEARRNLRRAVGMQPLEDAVADRWAGKSTTVDAGSDEALRARGAELLMHSADVRFEEGAHPAYARILAELSPDEARILRLMARTGPQPAVDVRTAGPPGVGLMGVGSKIVAMGFSMIGAEAGCRNLDRVPAYMNNLNRLGLIWFLREPIDDVLRYPVIEAQPDVIAAMKEAGRARTVRRSIHLTPFGQDFCEICLPVDTTEFEAQVAPGEPMPAEGDPEPGAEGPSTSG